MIGECIEHGNRVRDRLALRRRPQGTWACSARIDRGPRALRRRPPERARRGHHPVPAWCGASTDPPLPGPATSSRSPTTPEESRRRPRAIARRPRSAMPTSSPKSPTSARTPRPWPLLDAYGHGPRRSTSGSRPSRPLLELRTGARPARAARHALRRGTQPASATPSAARRAGRAATAASRARRLGSGRGRRGRRGAGLSTGPSSSAPPEEEE